MTLLIETGFILWTEKLRLVGTPGYTSLTPSLQTGFPLSTVVSSRVHGGKMRTDILVQTNGDSHKKNKSERLSDPGRLAVLRAES